MKKHLFLSVACLLASLLFGNLAFAIDDTSVPSIKLSPISNYFTIKAKDEQKYYFEVENAGTSPLSFKTYTAPYGVVGEEYDPDYITETNYNQIMRWITFENNEGKYVSEATYTVEPGASKKVYYKVKVPDDIPEGSQYCIIFAETINASSISGTSIKAVSRLAHVVLGHGKGVTNNSGSVTDMHLTGLFSTNGIDASAKIHNDGNTDFIGAYNLKIETIFGKQIYEDANNVTIFPETVRKISSSWSEAPAFGVFKVHYMVNAGGNMQNIDHIVFIIPVFVMIILLLLLTALIIWIIILIKKRKERKSRLVI